MRVLVLNGVNLDVLGRRDPTLYGGLSLAELESRIYEWARELELTVQCRQTNDEGEFVNWCHDALRHGRRDRRQPRRVDALRMGDPRRARAARRSPIVEVHLSNVDEREEWRRDVRRLRPRRRALRRPRARRLPKLALDLSEGARRMSARIERLRASLEEPLLVTNPVNVLYLTGFDSSNAALLVEPDRVRLFTDFRYIEAAQDGRGRRGGADEAVADRLARARSSPGASASRRTSCRGRSRSSCVQAGVELVPRTGPRRAAARA